MVSNGTQRALKNTFGSWSQLLSWHFSILSASSIPDSVNQIITSTYWVDMGRENTTCSGQWGVAYCIDSLQLSFVRAKVLYYSGSTGRLCLNHFFSEEEKAIKRSPWGSWVRRRSSWSWRLRFSSLWCWSGMDGKDGLLQCLWPVPSARNDSQRPYIQLSLQMGPRD